MRKDKYEIRRTQAKDFINKSYVANEQKGIKTYQQYIKEIENRADEEKKKERQWSFLEYENYKKKYESSLNNNSVYFERLRVSKAYSFI